MGGGQNEPSQVPRVNRLLTKSILFKRKLIPVLPSCDKLIHSQCHNFSASKEEVKKLRKFLCKLFLGNFVILSNYYKHSSLVKSEAYLEYWFVGFLLKRSYP